MLTKDDVDRIRSLHERNYSHSKIARQVKCSRSTVRNYLGLGKKPYKLSLPQSPTSKALNIPQLFGFGKCPSCGITYPMPKFMPSWRCPVCKKPSQWGNPENKEKLSQ